MHIVCLDPVHNRNQESKWQICYRSYGTGESVDLLGLFLQAIENFTDIGFAAFDHFSEVASSQKLISTLKVLTDQDAKTYADIAAALSTHLNIAAPA